MTTITKISKTFKTELKAFYPEEEIRTFVEILLEHYAGLNKTDMVLKTNDKLDNAVVTQIEKALPKLKKQQPLQYIIGETEFYGLNLKVNPSVLIPRPETEELVDWIIKNHKKDDKISVLDIATGCGCIALALKNNLPNAELFAVDISEKALETARQNAEFNKLNVSFVQLDILEPEITKELGKFDIIVSNPPYVREQEKKLMHKNVLENEPHLALFVNDNDALIFYKAIIRFANKHLNKQSHLYFEINEAFGDEMITLLRKKGYQDIELRKDINGKNRMIKGKRQ